MNELIDNQLSAGVDANLIINTVIVLGLNVYLRSLYCKCFPHLSFTLFSALF